MMQKILRQIPGWVVVLLLATLAAWPFLTRASLPTFTDAEMHVIRTQEIVQAWVAGVPYIRWAPTLFFGYGYPVFNFYSPLSYYLGAAYGLLCCPIEASAVEGTKFVLVFSLYLGALGMYNFVRDRWGNLSAIVSAAAFVFSPYLVYIDTHARGDVPETLALALIPWLLWSFARLRRTASPGDVVIAASLLALEILSHNLMSLMAFGLLMAWLVWDVVFGQFFLRAWVADETTSNQQMRTHIIVMLGAGVGLGLALAAFMWLPAVLERDAIQFRNVASGTYFDFRRYFIDVVELFSPALWFDLGATQMRFHYSVGVAQWALGAFGLLSVFSMRLRRLSVLFFALATVGLFYLMLPASLKFWEAIPPMAFFQFPTRFLGPTAVTLSVLAGAGVCWADLAPWKHSRLAYTVVAVAFCIASAMPLLYPPLWPDFGPMSAQRILATELTGRGVGTTSANDFLPIAVKVVPQPAEALVKSYATGQIEKFNRATLPTGTTVTTLNILPELNRFRVTGQTEFVFRLFTFYFPGWRAYVDGQPVEIMVTDPDGLITFWVPAGEHDVVVTFENTPIRRFGWFISGLAVLGVVLFTVWRLRLRLERPLSESLPWRQAGVLAGVVMVGLGARFMADGAGWWRFVSTGHRVLVAEHELFAPLEQNIALLAYDLPQKEARPGDKIPLTLYWKAQAPVKVNLQVFVHFIGPDGQLWGQADKWNPADFPTAAWPLEYYVRDEHEAVLRPDAPPGVYRVFAGLWDGDLNVRMRVLDANGQPTAADGVVLTEEFVVR